MAVLKGEAGKIFKKAAEESAAGSDWKKLFSGLADLAGDVACVMGQVAIVESDLRKMRQRATPLPRPRKEPRKDARPSRQRGWMTSRVRP